MSKTIFDSAKIDFPCPKCNHKMPTKIADLRKNPQLTCPSCGQSFTVDAAGFNKGAETAQKSIDELKRKLGKAFK
jgi:transcription elongation factor Elf1